MKTNLSVSYLSLIFARKREPTLITAERIARALNMGLEEFLIGLRGHVVRQRYDTTNPYAKIPPPKPRKTKKLYELRQELADRWGEQVQE